jgi:hypothetical protein
MENRPFQVDGAEERINKDVDTRQPLTENVLSSHRPRKSRFYAVLSKAASKWPSVKSTPDRSRDRNGQKAVKVFE